MITNVKKITINATSNPNEIIGTLFTCSEYRWINVVNGKITTSADTVMDTAEFAAHVAKREKLYVEPTPEELLFLQNNL